MEGGIAKERRSKPSESELFEFSVPRDLTTTCVDWRVPEQRKTITACLVQGVYNLERDRQKKREGNNRVAPSWWQAFNFKCIDTLIDIDHSIYGAIFEYNHHHNQFNSMADRDAPPKYVVAFRGTVIKVKTMARDVYLDIKIFLNKLNKESSRCKIALKALKNILDKEDPRNVWLAGHSLGAYLALQIGKDFAKQGCCLETYLFNPPYASAPIEKLKNPYLKNGIRVTRSFALATLSYITKDDNEDDDMFGMPHSWTPYLFLNPQDPICCEYIGYFEHRVKMEKWGMGKVERISCKVSPMSLLGRNGGGLHLIPSASVTKNMKNTIVKERDLLSTHGLCQWWESHEYWESKLYQYTSSIC